MKQRPREQEAVKTTIVGGRPPGSGKPVGPIPRGIEVLVKKAAIDADFKQILLDRRADAASEIDLVLEPSEVAMLNAVPQAQIEAIIARTTVHPRQRPAFLGKVAAVMIVALTAAMSEGGCAGIEPDRPDNKRKDRPERTESGGRTSAVVPNKPADAEGQGLLIDESMWWLHPKRTPWDRHKGMFKISPATGNVRVKWMVSMGHTADIPPDKFENILPSTEIGDILELLGEETETQWPDKKDEFEE